MSSQFVISLDFELLWGIRDQQDKSSYGKNILGGREAIPHILELFATSGIAATWATVGCLFCKNRDELMDIAPAPSDRPIYADPRLSNYTYLSEVGLNEQEDPYYFAGSLIDKVADTPRQEIATHTFSHFYTLEQGATDHAFEADLRAAKSIANAKGIQLNSIVFPRNQYSESHVEICRRSGIDTWRGNPTGWAYASTAVADQNLLRRGLRLIDAYSGMFGSLAFPSPTGQFRNVPASRFLRPLPDGRLAALSPLQLSTIKRGMTQAAKSGENYHLWWHPHNFGADVSANLAGLKTILEHFDTLRQSYCMQSVTMRGLI